MLTAPRHTFDPNALAARCLALSPDGPLALGLSGGGDSVALLHILSEASRAGGRELRAFIVDHRLRPESGAEARLTARRAAALGAHAEILTWTAPKKGQAAARRARHRLLAQACRDAGASTLFLAHTRDDQLETVQMRLARPGGWRGAAGMGARDPSPLWPEGADLALARPLLDVSRAGLRDWLTGIGAEWIEDPSNENPAYERVRVRRDGLTPDGEDAQKLIALSAAARGLEDSVRRAAAGLVHRAARLETWGGLNVEVEAVAAAPDLVALRAVEAMMLAASGEAGLPGPGAARILYAAMKAGAGAGAAGALTAPYRGAMMLGRDRGAARGRADGAAGAAAVKIKPGARCVFDGRFEIFARRPVLARAARDAETRGLDLPDALRAGLLALETEDGAVRLHGVEPGVEGVSVRLLAAARLRGLVFPFGAGTWFYKDVVL